MNMAKELVHEGHVVNELSYKEFAKISLEYIDRKVQRMLRRKSTQKFMEEDWLETLR